MFHTFPPEEEFTSSKTLKRDLINRDKQNLLAMKRDSSLKPPSLLSMISFYLNHPGSKYKKNELRNVGIVEFYDSVQRLQIYDQHMLSNGSYSGFVVHQKFPKMNLIFASLKGSADFFIQKFKEEKQMSFKLGDKIYKEILYFYAEDKGTGIPQYVLTQLSDANIEITAESKDVTDKNGNLVKKIWKSKAGTFSQQSFC